MAKKIKLSHSARRVSAYNKRFKSKVPVSAMRAGGHVAKIEAALTSGKPVQEWESELSRAQAGPEAERSLQQAIDPAPLPEESTGTSSSHESATPQPGRRTT